MHCILYNRWLVVLLLIVTNLSANSKGIWIPFDSSSKETWPSVEKITSNNSEYYVKITFHGIYVEDIKEDNTEYKKLSFGDIYSTAGFVGMPALPIVSQLIALPQGCTYTSTVTKEDSIEINIGTIYPSLKLVTETEKEIFVINDSVYGLELYEPTILNIGEQQEFRGIRNVSFNICPFKYFPTKKKLTVYRSVYVKVKFENRNKENISAFPYIDASARKLFDNIIDLPESSSTNSLRDNTTDYDYLIIVGDNTDMYNSQILKKFCKWKAFKGYKTNVVSASDIGYNCQSIKDYINSEYQNHHIKYTLFVANEDQIHLYNWHISPSDSRKSDYWYGCLGGDNDFQAEVAIGRFSTNDTIELKNMIDKSIAYESSETNHAQQAILIAHKEEAPGKYQGCSDEIYNAYHDSLQFTKVYGASPDIGGTNATNSDIISNIDNGVGIVNYRGHGNYYGWAYDWSSNNIGFTNLNVSSLTNTTYPIIFSIACHTSDLTQNVSLSETFMRSVHGSSAFLGATDVSYTSPNNIFNKFLFEHLLTTQNIYTMGDLYRASHVSTIASFSQNDVLLAKLNAMCYVCGGDPSLEIFTKNPRRFNNVTVNENAGTVQICTDSIFGYSASVVSERGELLFCDSTYSDTLNLSNVPSDAHIILNKHNYIPYEVRNFIYIQNETITDNQSYNGYITKVGSNVTSEKPNGSVIIENGGTLRIKSKLRTLVKGHFKCKSGGKLIIECN